MDIAANREMIWKRIEDGGPTSVVVSSGDEMSFATTQLLKKKKKELSSNQVIPVRIICKQNDDPVEFFKSIFYTIWKLMPPQFEGHAQIFKDLIDMAQETSSIDSILEKYLPLVKKQMNLNILLVLENFDVFVSHQDESDLMKVRGMAAHVNILTISRKMLKTLASENNQEEYFCNQFKAYTV